jgi:hypothetical protein
MTNKRSLPPSNISVDIHSSYSPVLIDAPDKVSNLIALIEESTRGDASSEKVNRFVEPAPGTLAKAIGRQHHVVFGRRGSGKTSLLRKSQTDLIARGHPVAYVDLDVYDSQTFPNLIASVLRDAFEQFRTLAQRRGLWHGESVIQRLTDEIAKLEAVIASPDEAKALQSAMTKRQNKKKGQASLKMDLSSFFKVGAKGEKKDANEDKKEVELKYATDKLELIHNHVGFYRQTIKLVAETFGKDVFLILDELYHIPQASQPLLLHYFHSVCRNNSAWLKVGTVKYRSRLMTRTSQGTRGIELRQDAQPINLDESFETFSQTQKFLMHILQAFATEVGLGNISDLASETAIKRLIQASGGVARDFMVLFVDAIGIARERLSKKSASRGRVSADDVWDAAASFNRARRSEFASDARLERPERLIHAIDSIKGFCFANELNCILVPDQVSGTTRQLIDEIWDCKLLHTVKSGLWIKSQQHTAYMLDVSEQASDWHMRRIIIDLTQEDNKLKTQLSQSRLIFSEVAA